MHSLLRLLTTLWLISLSYLLFSQNVSITYVNPPDLTVCDTATFEVTIANTLADTLIGATFVADMPVGVEYVQGSINNANENNVADPNSPLFDLLHLPPGESITLTFQARTRCSLVDAINNGDLFINTYRVDFTGGNTTVITTPYVIETALLQIVSLNDQMMGGVTGDVLTRTWVLTNTRLGALSSLTFTDMYADGIFITSPMGTVVTQQQGVLELELTGTDFMMFGDGDGLFELNEQITITETIEITGCGVPPQSTSFLTASWGCHGEVCQSVSTTGVVTIASNGQTPNILSQIIDPFPADYCASISSQQGIMLTNNGLAAATDLAVYVSHLNDGSMGLQSNSLTVTNAGNTVDAQVDFFLPLNFDACATPPNTFDSVAMVIPELLPGDTIFILWDAYVCAVDCDAELPEWRYEFYHENDCPVGSFGAGGEVSQPFGAAQLLSQFVTYYLGEFLEDGGEYTLTYTLKSPILVDSTGTLRIDFDLPCGVGWGNNDNFNLNGQSPDSVSIIPGVPSGDNVSLFFDLPLGIDTVSSDFNITFECDSNCFDLPDCIVEFVSSCPIPPATGVFDDVRLDVNSTLLLNNAQCGPQSCEEFNLTYFCEASTDEICPDTIIGYFTTEMGFHRENLGLPDNDNNRYADGAGNLDFNNIRRDRALTGDTLHTTVNGTMTIDLPGQSIPNAVVVVNFESHTIDDGWDGGEFMDTLGDIQLVFDSTGFVNLGGTITITDASTGNVFECELPSPNITEEGRGEISVVNTRPKDIFDLWYFISYAYNITPEFLLSQGCDIPPGWEFEDGDEIEANVYHRPMYNPTPAKVINMRTTTAAFAANLPGPLQDDYFACGANSMRWQLGGYRFNVHPGLYQMPSCESGSEPGNTFIEFNIARPNFFPFEFRNFMDLFQWDYILPPDVNLLDSKVELLNIQGGAVLLQDAPISWTQNSQIHEFDISNLPLELIDEGFFLRFNHEFEMPCDVTEPQPLSIDLYVEFAPSLPVDSNPLDTIYTGTSTLFPIRPKLEFFPVNINHESTSNMAFWDFEFANLTVFDETALNAWMSVYSPSGQVTDFQLINMTTGQTIPLENGIFQLGDLPPDWMNEFQLVANINNCEPDLIEVTFGWNCDPYTDLMSDVCFQETEILTLTALLGELEMDVQSPVGPFQLCDTIGYHTVEIFNAQFGAVYDIELLAALPEGLTIMPGTSEIEYPAGSGFQPIGDPVFINADTALYALSSQSQLLSDQGLQGFDQAPDHSVKIRFKAATECGFVSPSQIIFNASGTQGCGLDANNLSKPGEELFIEGVTPLYDANITIGTNIPPSLSCGDSIKIDVTLEADAPTAGTDSVFVYIPPGLAFQPGTYVPGQNASPDAPIIDFDGSQFILKWPLVDGIQPFTPITFSMTFAAVAGGGECDSTILEIVTYQLQEAECIATGDLCSILAETGRRDLEVIFTIPSLALDDFTYSVDNGEVLYSVQLENNGNATTDDLVITLYNDVDNSGTFTPGDTPLHTHEQFGGLGSGQSINATGSFPAFYSILCNVIAVVDNQDNCTCTEDVETGPNVVMAVFEPDSTCLGNEFELFFGAPDMSGHIYQWSPDEGLECTDCASPVLSTNQLSVNSLPATVNFNLMDTYPNGCTVDYNFPVYIVDGSTETEETIENCADDLFFLNGPDEAIVFEWDGPGVVDSSLQSQGFVLNDTTEITLIWTDQFECQNTVNYFINVPEAITVDTLPLCLGDSVVVDTVVFYEEVEVCDTVFESGCEVVRCLFYEPRDTPVVNFPLDTICVLEGTEITIDQLGEGFVSYAWTPTDVLSCDSCANPSLEVVNQTFQVTVTDETECSATTQVTVVAIPPCSNQSIEMPNVFTPNGDGTNDSFGPVMMPGIDKLITSAKLRIWDRWGKKVYEGEGVSGIYWDGNIGDRSANQEVFIFMLDLACEEDEVTIKGNVTLLR